MSLALLVLVFLVAAGAVWIAGIHLSNTTDVLDHRLGFGEAIGGLVILSIATNLPEIAITVSAALSHDLGIAIGNILGGIAIQTVVLVVLDAFGLGAIAALTYRAASLAARARVRPRRRGARRDDRRHAAAGAVDEGPRRAGVAADRRDLARRACSCSSVHSAVCRGTRAVSRRTARRSR